MSLWGDDGQEVIGFDEYHYGHGGRQVSSVEAPPTGLQHGDEAAPSQPPQPVAGASPADGHDVPQHTFANPGLDTPVDGTAVARVPRVGKRARSENEEGTDDVRSGPRRRTEPEGPPCHPMVTRSRTRNALAMAAATAAMGKKGR